MSKIKNGDWVKCTSSLMPGSFTAGFPYQIERVDSSGFASVYNDNGDKCLIDYPHDPDYGKFEKVD